jgi:hypothetical protein
VTIFSCDSRNCELSLRKDVTSAGSFEIVTGCKMAGNGNFGALNDLDLARREASDVMLHSSIFSSCKCPRDFHALCAFRSAIKSRQIHPCGSIGMILGILGHLIEKNSEFRVTFGRPRNNASRACMRSKINKNIFQSNENSRYSVSGRKRNLTSILRYYFHSPFVPFILRCLPFSG